MAAVVLLKFWLTARQEIVVQPHDDWWFVSAAEALFWGRDYQATVFMKLPVYPLFVWLVSQVGIPLRLVTEAGLGLAAASFAFALLRLGVPRWAAFAAMALAVLHPLTIGAFNLAVADNLYAILVLAAFAQLVHLLAARGRETLPRSLAFALLFAAAWCTRPESLVLGLTMAIAAGVVAFVGWREGRGYRRLLRSLALVVVIPLGAAFAAQVSITALNFWAWGGFVTLDYKAPQFRRAFDALQAVESGPAVRYVSITAAQRRAAYDTSPTLKTLEPLLEGDFAASSRQVTLAATGVRGDVASGWFLWLFRNAAAKAGHHPTFAASEEFYGRIADELEEAFRTGTLRRKRLLGSFIDTNYGTWLPHLPASLVQVAANVVRQGTFHAMHDDPAAAHVLPLFQRMTGRRGLRDGHGGTVRGWVFRPCQEVTRLAAENDAGRAVHAREVRIARPDVTPPPGSGCVNRGVGYTLAAPSAVLSAARIAVDFADGDRLATPAISSLRIGIVHSLKTAAGQDAYLAIDHLQLPEPQGPARRAVFALLPELQTWGLAALAAVVALAWARAWPVRSLAWLAACPLAAFFAIRLLVFAIIDASAWPGAQARYIVPLGVLAPFIVAALWPVRITAEET